MDISSQAPDSRYKGLYTAGGAAALVAGVLFRRNLAAELGLFVQQPVPAQVSDWFRLLQSQRLLGLAYLNFFDLFNFALVGLMFLALYAALRRHNPGGMLVSAVLGLAGAVVYFATNTALSLLALSAQYTSATSETQKAMLETGGQVLLAANPFTGPGGHPGAGGYMSLLLVAAAGMIASVVMLRSAVFKRATAYVGLLANALDLAYCLAYFFVPLTDSDTLALIFIPGAGLLRMIWHLLAGWRLCLLGRRS